MHSRIMVVRKAHALSVAVRIGTVRLSWRCYHLQTTWQMLCKAIVVKESKTCQDSGCFTWTQSTRWREPDIQKPCAFVNNFLELALYAI
jgi:hypothetical protein